MDRHVWRNIAVAALVVLGAAASPAQEPPDHPMIGTPAPPFELESVNGHPSLSLEDLRGRYVVLHFGTSW